MCLVNIIVPLYQVKNIQNNDKLNHFVNIKDIDIITVNIGSLDKSGNYVKNFR